MNAKATIRKIFFVSLWLIIGGGIITLLAAAMHKQKNERCKNYIIKIKEAGSQLFISEIEIAELLSQTVGGQIEGLTLSSFNLQQLERKLEADTWIADAELYFDSKAILHITVTEKKPIARIFTITGSSFYIDNSLRRLPLSEKISAKVPVFTGFPERKGWLMMDSLLAKDVRTIAQIVLKDEFWMSQVSQIDITADKNFEMIPLVGNHIVKLGGAEDIEKKFDRLFVFYKKILPTAGFNKYPVIDVQYKGQVIATRTDNRKKIDSVQLRKNVERLLQVKSASNEVIDSDKTDLQTLNPSVETSTNPSPVKPEAVSNQKEKIVEEKRVPKAVMPKRSTNSINKDNVP